MVFNYSYMVKIKIILIFNHTDSARGTHFYTCDSFQSAQE